MLLAPHADTACASAAADEPPSQLVRSVAHMSKDEGRYRTAWKILCRCLELLFLLSPVVCTLPLLRTRLRAMWLRLLVATLERCGPVGIKWGQWASTRYDIFEDDLCDALGVRTPPPPRPVARACVYVYVHAALQASHAASTHTRRRSQTPRRSILSHGRDRSSRAS